MTPLRPYALIFESTLAWIRSEFQVHAGIEQDESLGMPVLPIWGQTLRAVSREIRHSCNITDEWKSMSIRFGDVACGWGSLGQWGVSVKEWRKIAQDAAVKLNRFDSGGEWDNERLVITAIALGHRNLPHMRSLPRTRIT